MTLLTIILAAAAVWALFGYVVLGIARKGGATVDPGASGHMLLAFVLAVGFLALVLK
jgi:hypothetical protein